MTTAVICAFAVFGMACAGYLAGKLLVRLYFGEDIWEDQP